MSLPETERVSCPGCWRTTTADLLCGCDADDGPLCPPCHRIEHEDTRDPLEEAA